MLPMHLVLGLITGMLLAGAQNKRDRYVAIGTALAAVVGWGLIVLVGDGHGFGDFVGGAALAGVNIAIAMVVGAWFGARLNRNGRPPTRTSN